VRQKFLSVVRSQSPQSTSYIHVENKTLVFYREVLAMALCLSVCLCLYSSQVVVRSKRPSESSWFWYGSFVRPILHRVMEKFGYPKIRVLPPGTLSQTQDLENFATASRSCCQQNASSVELTGRIYDGRRVVAGSTYFIARPSSVRCNYATCCGFVVQRVPTVVQQLTRFRLA